MTRLTLYDAIAALVVLAFLSSGMRAATAESVLQQSVVPSNAELLSRLEATERELATLRQYQPSRPDLVALPSVAPLPFGQLCLKKRLRG